MVLLEIHVKAYEWRRWDSNPRPPACKAGALATELRPQEPRPGPLGATTTTSVGDLPVRSEGGRGAASPSPFLSVR
jgi:hypothetical protein